MKILILIVTFLLFFFCHNYEKRNVYYWGNSTYSQFNNEDCEGNLIDITLDEKLSDEYNIKSICSTKCNTFALIEEEDDDEVIEKVLVWGSDKCVRLNGEEYSTGFVDQTTFEPAVLFVVSSITNVRKFGCSFNTAYLVLENNQLWITSPNNADEWSHILYNQITPVDPFMMVKENVHDVTVSDDYGLPGHGSNICGYIKIWIVKTSGDLSYLEVLCSSDHTKLHSWDYNNVPATCGLPYYITSSPNVFMSVYNKDDADCGWGNVVHYGFSGTRIDENMGSNGFYPDISTYSGWAIQSFYLNPYFGFDEDFHISGIWCSKSYVAYPSKFCVLVANGTLFSWGNYDKDDETHVSEAPVYLGREISVAEHPSIPWPVSRGEMDDDELVIMASIDFTSTKFITDYGYLYIYGKDYEFKSTFSSYGPESSLPIRIFSDDKLEVVEIGGEYGNMNYFAAVELGMSTTAITLLIVVPLSAICSVILIIFAIVILIWCFFVLKRGFKRKGFDKFDMVLKEEEEMKENRKFIDLNINESLFVIEYSDLKVKQSIGKGGSNSVVFQCVWKNKEVAFKCFRTADLLADQHSFDEFEKEVNILASLKHPNILIFFGATLCPPRVGIITEFCANGDLKNYLEKNVDYPYENRIRILKEVAGGMEYLHDRKVIHRDLKSENVLLNANFEPKIIDFGLSKIVERMSQSKTKAIGTTFYMSPEITKGGDYTEKCDVFSYAIILFEVLSTNFTPYGISMVNVEYKVAGDPNYRPDVSLVQIDAVKYKWVINLMRRCWIHNPNERPSFQEIREEFSSNEKVVGKLKEVVKAPELPSTRRRSRVIEEGVVEENKNTPELPPTRTRSKPDL